MAGMGKLERTEIELLCAEQRTDLAQITAEEALAQAELDAVIDVDLGDDGLVDRDAALRALRLEDDEDQPVWRRSA